MNILDYLGKPWENGASGPDSFDCWGLVRSVYLDHGITLPVVDVDAHRSLNVRHAFNADLVKWNRLEHAENLCAVLMSKGKQPDHVGVWLHTEGGGVLHSIQGAGVVYNGIRSLGMMGYKVLGFYSWKG
jgi:cell wall-associated NlpC family hydrolase